MNNRLQFAPGSAMMPSLERRSTRGAQRFLIDSDFLVYITFACLTNRSDKLSDKLNTSKPCVP
jgi:hypothetical protein